MQKFEMENNNTQDTVLNNQDTSKENQEEYNFKKGKHLLSSYLKFVSVVFFVVVAFGVGFWFGEEGGSEQAREDEIVVENSERNREVDFSLFWDVWDLLNEKYVDAGKLDAQKLLYGSINGMLAATGDPYTTFFNPEENKEFSNDMEGKFEGIGAEIGIKNKILTIVAPLEGSPAKKAGLRSGDKILKINGESTAEMGINDAISKIRGEKGTEVALTIFRNNGENTTEEIKITRGLIVVDSVTLEMKDDVAYFKVVRFGEDTSVEFLQLALSARGKTRGMVIDMRNNPGGYLYAAIEMANILIPKDRIVVIEEDQVGKRTELKTEGGDIFSDIPVVVLINEGSASASEILAGALRENRDNVTIVGETSFGKGSVQELIGLEGDSALKVTIAKWLTPKGNQINEVGISPDVEIDLTGEDYENDRDPQLDKALELLKK